MKEKVGCVRDKSLQSFDPVDCNPPGSSVHGILQARILERIAMLSSRGSSPPCDQTHVSCIAGGFFIAEPLGKHDRWLLDTQNK